MESTIRRHLQPEFEPVAVVWSDTIPDDAVQFKNGKFGCILYLFAEAARNGKIAGGNRESIACNGGRAALGLGVDLDESDNLLDRYAAVFSKGLKSSANQKAYIEQMEATPKYWHSLFKYGERRHSNPRLAREWILKGLPRYDIPYEFVLFKPLSKTDQNEIIKAVIFSVNIIELSGLVTLAGSVMQGTEIVRIPIGADCNSIASFVYVEGDSAAPRAVLGMLGVDGRRVMRKRFRDDIVTLALPFPLFQKMEQEADDCVFQIPSWKGLTGKD